MKTMKKIFCIFLVVLMCLTSAPLSGFVDADWSWLELGLRASADNELAATGQCGENVYWNFNSATGEIVISGSGVMYDYYHGDSPFNNSDIENVIIVDGVTSIGSYIFYACENLTTITIPNGVVSIGDSAFAYCYNLTTITIPDSVTTIGVRSFYHCNSLTSVIIPKGVTTIDDEVFGFCHNLTSITIPESVTTIGDEAFSYCTNLTNITIPDNVMTIGDSAFYNCIDLTSVIIPDGVTSIGVCAFHCCVSLTDISIGSGVTFIGGGAFYLCDNLMNINVDVGNSAYSSDSRGVLFDKNKTNLIQYPVGNMSTEYIVPDSVTTISGEAFYSCDSLTRVTIGDNVTTIGYSAFYSCGSLTSVIIGESVTAIDALAFHSCDSLTSLTIPNSVKTIGVNAFSCCYNLTSVTIGDGVLTIDDRAFAACDSLTSITIPDSVTTIGDLVFYHCDSLTDVTIGDSVITLGEESFSNCVGLTNVTIGVSVTIIAYCAFNWCDNLTDVYYKGTEEQWKKISIGSYNEDLTSATIHYNSTEGNTPSTPGKPDNNDNEEPRDFSDYEVESGKLEEVIYGVDNNGNEYITEVIVNGKNYKVEKDAEIIALSQGQLNQNVAVAILDGEVVMLVPVTYLTEDDVTSHIKDDIGLYCSYGYMYSEEDESHGFKWSEPDENGIVYPIYEFNSNKELQLKTYLTQNDFFVLPSNPEFDSELMEYVTSQLTELQIHIDKIQLKLRNTNAISFDGKDTYTINVNADLKTNQTLSNTIPIKVKSEYEIPEDKDVELVLFDIVITGKQNGEKVEFTNTENIKIKNLDYVEPTTDKDTSKPTGKQYAKEAAQKLDNISGAISLTGLLELFSNEELEYIGNVLLAEIAMAEAPKDTLEDYLSKKVIDKLFNIDSSFLKLRNEEIEVTVAGDTKYGEIKLKLICKYSKVAFYGSDFCFTGQVNYEVIGGNGAEKLPSSFKKSGLAGMFSSVDMESFCNSAYKLFETHLHSGVDEVWGNDVDGAADLIFGTIVNDILSETELESVSNIAFELIAKPGKSVTVKCPVDVLVYDENNELVAAVVGNEVILTNDKAQISVDGDIKTVKLFDESYNIIYRAIADGKMQITVEEYGTSTGLLNSSTITEIPLIAGRTYTQTIDDEYMENSDYKVVSASGNEYAPDSGYSTLDGHDYVLIAYKEGNCVNGTSKLYVCSKCKEYYQETQISQHDYRFISIGKEPTCTEDGYTSKRQCTICNLVQGGETIEATGHNFDGSKCKNCDYDKADTCSCSCHKNGIAKFFFNFILFFQRIFKANKTCKCGINHY